ncbi:hypothetical protein D9M72_450190 [compost metagenome]
MRCPAVAVGRQLRFGQEFVPEPQPLANGHAVVLVTVDHQHGGADLLDVQVGRIRQGHLGRHFLQPVLRRVGGGAELVQGPQAGMGDDRAEAVRLPRHPVGHVAPEGTAHGSRPRRINVRTFHHGVRDRHEVRKWRLAPLAPAPLNVGLAVAGGESGIRQEDGIAPGHQEPRVPAPRPCVPRAEGSAVDPEQQRRLVLRGGTLRQGKVGGNPGAIGGSRFYSLQ